MNPERAIQTVEATQVVAADAHSVLEIISRVAADPKVDVDRLGKLLDMHERLSARDAERAYNDAMTAAQAEMRAVAADANNPSTKSRYASYAALDRALRPIYTGHGFSLSFGAGENAPPEHVRVVCRVAHREGHKEFPHIDMPADGKGAKGGDVMTKTHATGAAFSYGQRYLLKAIFNIAVGEDNDGNAPAFPGDWITEQEVAQLTTLMDASGADRDRFLNYLRVDTLAHLPKRRFKEALDALAAKKKAAAQ